MKDPSHPRILGDRKQTGSYLRVHDAATLTVLDGLHRSRRGYQECDVGKDNSLSIDTVVDLVIETMELRGVERISVPVLQGVGWPIKTAILDMEDLRGLGLGRRWTELDSRPRVVNGLNKLYYASFIEICSSIHPITVKGADSGD